MSVIKERYFKTRNTRLAAQTGREALGEREVQTLLSMLGADTNAGFLAGKSVSDLGSGDQYIRKAFEVRGASYRGIDIGECNLETEDFPLEEQSTDIAVCLALIEHLADPGQFLTEVIRILKPGGILWMSTPDIEACGVKFWDDPTHVHPYTRKSLRMLLEMNGFEDVIVTPNYRCKPRDYYTESALNFFRARHLMPFSGVSRLPVPSFLKGACTGLFALGTKREP
jgi:2-polyprenyl-3-methyl-5-hydroxy-6-metoxy-1,4-benzoquinol methylase